MNGVTANSATLDNGTPSNIALPNWLTQDLRSDHAGETGAIWIYKGVLAVARDTALRAFATRHLETERKHLARVEDVLPARRRSRLLPLWRIAGWLTGAVPSVFGPNAVYATIEAVETFVDQHYQEQIDRLSLRPDLALVRTMLEQCRQDEVAHRDEARALRAPRPPWLSGWCWLVGAGSAGAVAAARRV